MFTKENLIEGQLLLLDKPLHWTSFQVVNKIKWSIKRKYALRKIKVGHAGTLDPLATGLLVVAVGKATKQIMFIQGAPKEYTGIITLGATTPSYDLETPFDVRYETTAVTEKLIQQTAQSFLGKTLQTPPIFSALKKDGKRMYELARQGEKVEIKPREITIDHFEITKIEMPHISFRLKCGKGTYVRSIAHDFGKKMNTGAHLSALRRTAIGQFLVEKAMLPDAIESLLA